MKSRLRITIIAILLAFGQAAKFLKEKRIPGLKNFGKWDPLLVNRVKITQDNSRVISLDMDLQNVLISGISKVVVKEAKFDTRNWVVNVKFLAPRLDFDSDYKIKGRVLSLPLNGQGKTNFYSENLNINAQIQLKLRTDGDNTFTEIVSLRAKIENISNFHTRVDNLFNGQKDLEDSANALFNENWRELYEALRPAVEQTIEKTLEDRLKRVFHYVPANYFIVDIPKAQ